MFIRRGVFSFLLPQYASTSVTWFCLLYISYLLWLTLIKPQHIAILVYLEIPSHRPREKKIIPKDTNTCGCARPRDSMTNFLIILRRKKDFPWIFPPLRGKKNYPHKVERKYLHNHKIERKRLSPVPSIGYWELHVR